MVDQDNKKLAVLIDADNAQAVVCSELLAEIAIYGTANIKRAYGDWTTTNLKSWKDYLLKHAIQPIQQFSYTIGKNATDSSMIIDAMDLLHDQKLDGFCIVSSDSDFTRLATRIREEGLVVYGFGEKKTPKPFVSACDKFTYTEVLRRSKNNSEVTKQVDTDLKEILIMAIRAVSKEDGWAPLSGVGGYINKNYPSFDSRNYDYDKLGQLIKSVDYLDVDEQASSAGSQVIHIYIKLKK
ncbi:MAG: NYN domain-containing protein [Mariprofundaceae bacterium]|nr:NYN domain-containing protein [Mariprofundaceae bacterium]